MRCIDCKYCVNEPKEYDEIIFNSTCTLYDWAIDNNDEDICDEFEYDC